MRGLPGAWLGLRFTSERAVVNLREEIVWRRQKKLREKDI